MTLRNLSSQNIHLTKKQVILHELSTCYLSFNMYSNVHSSCSMTYFLLVRVIMIRDFSTFFLIFFNQTWFKRTDIVENIYFENTCFPFSKSPLEQIYFYAKLIHFPWLYFDFLENRKREGMSWFKLAGKKIRWGKMGRE